jgi:hypothetical protein|tara:strand:+ start:4003 stop:5232 length:1230 start_codon:yes stop_codon:yes gene_type:complete
MKFREYQKNIIDKGTEIIKDHGFIYLAMEVRTGKTLTSLGICNNLKINSVLFITKKKAISSIVDDYNKYDPNYFLEVINYESLHKVKQTDWDVVICDESHSLGAFPKPNKRAKQVREIINRSNPFVILLSGTPTPESYSQMYHQVYGIPNNPFNKFKNFYAFSKVHIKVKQKFINSIYINDYTKGLKSIIDEMSPFKINYSQKMAGFKTTIEEKILYVNLSSVCLSLIKKIKKDRVIEGKGEIVLADTGVKLMSKVHQLCSGTVKFESGKSMVVDTTKAKFINKFFKDQKIGIFYKFKEEYNAIKKIYKDMITNDLEEFNATEKSIALQIVSGREGISLKEASALVYYNIDFSATSYWQSRDRMTTKNRATNKIYWIFSNDGIENEIYKTVVKKKDYTLTHFKRDLLDL